MTIFSPCVTTVFCTMTTFLVSLYIVRRSKFQIKKKQKKLQMSDVKKNIAIEIYKMIHAQKHVLKTQSWETNAVLQGIPVCGTGSKA